MMSNLFMIFDPLTSLGLCVNWLSSLLGLTLYPVMYWFVPSRFYMFWVKMSLYIYSEFKVLFDKKAEFSSLIIFVSFMFYIFFNNFLGLFSYIFVSSSHLVFGLLFSCSLWVGLMFYGWFKDYNKMFIHMVPMGTPDKLMVFMVMIETVSNLIRPITLSVRLTANMIAGHLLLTLLGGLGEILFLGLMLMLFIQIMLEILELFVSIIQSYVFVVLGILYLNEVVYEKSI